MPSLTASLSFATGRTHKIMHLVVAEKDANFRRRCCTNSQAGSHSLSLRRSLSSALPLLASTATLSRVPTGSKCDRRASVTLRSLAHWPGNLGDGDEENYGGGRGSISQHLKKPSETICASSTSRRPSQENGHGQRERIRIIIWGAWA